MGRSLSTFALCYLAALSFLACEAASTEGGGGGHGDSCNTTDCTLACQSAGYTEGLCSEAGICECSGSSDGDTDGDTDSDSDSDADTSGPTVCDVDLLFVFDTSGSMFDAAQALRETAVPSFIEQLETYADLGTYRIGMTNHLSGIPSVGVSPANDSALLTRGFDPEYACQDIWQSQGAEGGGCDAGGHEYETLAGSYVYYYCDTVPELDYTVDCGLSGDFWIDGESSTKIEEFQCLGNIFCHQSADLNEASVLAGVDALEYEPNASFFRDEALLMVVFITDEDDASFSITGQEAYDRVLALKGGNTNYVVVAAISGPKAGSVEVNLLGEKGCVSSEYGTLKECPRLVGFTEMFGDHGLHVDLCNQDMSSAMTEALDKLQMSCDVIVIE